MAAYATFSIEGRTWMAKQRFGVIPWIHQAWRRCSYSSAIATSISHALYFIRRNWRSESRLRAHSSALCPIPERRRFRSTCVAGTQVELLFIPPGQPLPLDATLIIPSRQRHHRRSRILPLTRLGHRLAGSRPPRRPRARHLRRLSNASATSCSTLSESKATRIPPAASAYSTSPRP